MFENTFKNVDDILHKDAGCSSELDYVEQSSWVLFLKYLEDLESARMVTKQLAGEKYKPLIADKFRWTTWACPKTKDGLLDHNKALIGDDLRDFVNNELFPYLAKFKQSATDSTTLEYKIGEIFSEIKNRLQSGYNLREVLNLIDELKFQTSEHIHEMSHLYEDKIKNMGNAGRNGGEYYTPRPLIKAIIKVIQPKIGQTIYDGASGSAGFLCEAFAYLLESKKLTPTDVETLQKKTFFGKEKKSLAYIIGTMNMILHGIDAPNIVHTNTLGENIADIQEKDRFDVVLANPPFGGKERAEVQQNFPIKTGETAYLFLQHFMKILRAGGSAGIVIKNTFLSNTDNASIALRKELLENHNLHTILDCPSGTFQGAGVKTVVLFFKKGEPTKKIWYYQLTPGRNMGKTNPLNEQDLADFIELQKKCSDSDLSWSIDVSSINNESWDLSVKNPNVNDGFTHRSPIEIIREIEILGSANKSNLQRVKNLLIDYKELNPNKLVNEGTIEALCNVEYGTRVVRKKDAGTIYPVYGGGGETFFLDSFNREDRVVVARFAMSEKCTRRVSGKFALNDSGLTLSTKNQKILRQDFLDYYVLSLNDKIYECARGTAQKNLDVPAFRQMIVTFPASLDTQREIVEKLDLAFAEVETVKNQIAIQKDFSETLWHSLLSDALSSTKGIASE